MPRDSGLQTFVIILQGFWVLFFIIPGDNILFKLLLALQKPEHMVEPQPWKGYSSALITAATCTTETSSLNSFLFLAHPKCLLLTPRGKRNCTSHVLQHI